MAGLRSACAAMLLGVALSQSATPEPSAAPPALSPCSVSDHGATYDLTGLTIKNDGTSNTDGYYLDDRNNPNGLFDYYFNVCNDISVRTTSGLVPLQCTTTTGSDGNTQTGPAPAFQVYNGTGACQRLGNSAALGSLSVFMDQNSRGMQDRTWAHGVMLNYIGGDACPMPDPNNPGQNIPNQFIPRNVTILFECSTNPINMHQDFVVETRSCQYFIVIKSYYGCPTQCSCLPSDPTCNLPTSRPCSGHGVCGWDATNTKAKCFCNEKWIDGDGPCSHFAGVGYVAPKVNFGPNIAGGFFGGCLIGAVGVAAFFVIKAKMSGGSFMDALDFSRVFGGGSGSGNAPYTFTSLPGAPPSSGAGAAFMGSAGAADGYAPPDVSASAPTTGLAAAYAASGEGDYAASLA